MNDVLVLKDNSCQLQNGLSNELKTLILLDNKGARFETIDYWWDASLKYPIWQDGRIIEDDSRLFNDELAKWKAERAEAVNNIVVTVDGNQYNGDETSQTRMSRAIQALVGDEQVEWTMADGVEVVVTQTELGKALRLASVEQSRLWTLNKPRRTV